MKCGAICVATIALTTIGCADTTLDLLPGKTTGMGTPGVPPTLTPGVWTNITPPQADLAGTYGANSIDLDPNHPFTLYVSLDQRGLWKSTDGGTSWARLGNPTKTGPQTTSYLDSPLRVAVDPADSNHLYGTQGVRGVTLGFWVSHDAGQTWSQPPGFIAIAPTTTLDVSTLAVDEADFDHVLVACHSPWIGQAEAGILVTSDGGQTFTTSAPPSGGFQAESVGLGFVDSTTWIVNGNSCGTWRTADTGKTWAMVSALSGVEGGCESYRDASGILYFAGYQYPYRSTDSGLTWSQITMGTTYGYYLSILGDGKNLYTAPSFPAEDAMHDEPYLTSPESDGLAWSEYQGGAQRFDNGPVRMRFDAVNRILYSANWNAGVWALKTSP